MATKVFRTGGGLLLAGLLFTVLPAVMWVGMVNSIKDGTFTMNDKPVPPGDSTTIVEMTLFILVFVVVGLLLCGYAWLARVVIASDKVTIYNLIGMKSFEARWDEVTGYRRVPGRWSNMSSQWQVSAGEQTGNLPTYPDEPAMQLAMIDHLPRNAIEPEHRPYGVLPPAQAVSGTIRNGTDVFAAFFSVLWYAVIGLMAFVIATKISTPKPASLVDQILPWLALFFFAAIPVVPFRDAWRRLSHGSISADSDGIRYTDGVVSFGSPWANLRFIECRTATYSNRDSSFSNSAYRTVEQLILISGESGIQLDSNLPHYEHVKNFALAYAPPTAYVFVND